MKDGMFIFDSVVHMQNMTPENTRTPVGAEVAAGIQATVNAWDRPSMRGNPNIDGHCNNVEEAGRWLFEESDTDMVMVQTVPLLEYWRNGLSPPDVQAELARAYPDRVVMCGGVDPLYQGLRGAQAEMERQVNDLGARSFKLYQAQSRTVKWRADDPAVAYPIYEKALELGVTFIQFHKGLPLGDQNLEDLRSLDIQGAALDFPDITFGLHHLGDPFFDETIAVAARRANVVLVLPIWFNQYFVQPRKMMKLLGEALFNVGADRLLYGSEGFLYPRVQTFIDSFASMDMPMDLQEGYGYPALDRESKEKIFGRNLARILGIDVEAKLKELAGEPVT
jgi:predicted TIM-barrel fold metal-dependent hydrolase